MQEAEVNSEEQDRVEYAEFTTYVFNSEDAGIAHTTISADVDRPRGHVDGDDLMASPLKLEGATACSAADVEHRSLYEVHGLLFDVRPGVVGRDVVGRAIGHDDEAVVALHYLLPAA